MNVENSVAMEEIKEMNSIITKNNAKYESDTEDDDQINDKLNKSKKRKPSNILKRKLNPVIS
jgi:hypothetical protein